ncbi:hypothetical protein LINGRAHAP2_LOCUS5949, partial [Linum grandiflorum]
FFVILGFCRRFDTLLFVILRLNLSAHSGDDWCNGGTIERERLTDTKKRSERMGFRI